MDRKRQMMRCTGFLLARLALFLTCLNLSEAAAVEPDEIGLASYYSNYFHGQKTASGEPFDTNALTGAHRTVPFGTRLRVTMLETGKQVVVRINDRGPFVRGRVIDVSRSAAEILGLVGAGLARVKIEILP